MPRQAAGDTVLEPPTTEKQAEKQEEKPDNGFRTVVYGYGNVPPNKTHYVAMHGAQLIEFTGGVARHVPKDLADLLLNKSLPESEKKKGRETPYGYIKCLVLPDEATEADILKATGMKPIPARKLGALLEAVDLKELVAALGPDRATGIAKDILKTVAST